MNDYQTKYYKWLQSRSGLLQQFEITPGYGRHPVFFRELPNGLSQQITLGHVKSVRNALGKRAQGFLLDFPHGKVEVRIPALIELQKKYERALISRDVDDPLATNFRWWPQLETRLLSPVIIVNQADITENAAFIDDFLQRTEYGAGMFVNNQNIYNYIESRPYSTMDSIRVLYKVLVKAPDLQQAFDYFIWGMGQIIEENLYKIEHVFNRVDQTSSVLSTKTNLENEIVSARSRIDAFRAMRAALTREWEGADPIFQSAEEYKIGNYASAYINHLKLTIESADQNLQREIQILDTMQETKENGEEQAENVRFKRLQVLLMDTGLKWSQLQLARLRGMGYGD